MTTLLTAQEASALRVGVNVIVLPGDRCPTCQEPGLLYDPRVQGNVVTCHTCDGAVFVAPQDWVALTGPCSTCEHAYIRGSLLKFNKRGTGFHREPCPDCRDGRRIVPLYTDDPCYADTHGSGARTGNGEWTCAAHGSVNGAPVLVGRAAVVSIEPEDDGRNFHITLDVTEVTG